MPRVVTKEQHQRLKGLKVVNMRRYAKVRKMAVKEFWDMYFFVNMMKVRTYMVKLKATRSRWEKKWYKQITECWEEGSVDSQGTEVRWGTDNLLYCGVMPWTKRAYIGETARGFRVRIQQHTWASRATGKGIKKRYYLDVSKLGSQRMIWFPLRSW